MTTTARPPVTVETELSALMDRVAALWPRYKLTPEQAGGIWRRHGRHGIHALLNALDAHHVENLDERAPNWMALGWILKRGKPVEVTRQEDGADYIRQWWRSWRNKAPDWAHEILNYDAERPGNVTPADYENWNNAWLALVHYWQRIHDRPWWPDGAKTMRIMIAEREVTVTLGECGAPPGNEMREWTILRCHLYVRNLRTFGHASDRWREDVLRALEDDARRGAMKLDHWEYPEADAPY